MFKPWCPDISVRSVLNADYQRKQRIEDAQASNNPVELLRTRIKVGISLKTLFGDVHEDAKKQVAKFFNMCKQNHVPADRLPTLEEAYTNLGKAVFNFTVLSKAHEILVGNTTKLSVPIPQEFIPLRVCYAQQIDLCAQMVYALIAEQDKQETADKAKEATPV
jgi:hypothetical protein